MTGMLESLPVLSQLLLAWNTNALFRSDAAYARAAAGAGNAAGFKVVETGANGLVTKG